jgi:hypothetical protein
MPKDNIDYSNTIIYKIYCNDTSVTDTYIGYTTNFIKRKYQHKMLCNSNKKLKIYDTIRNNGGWDNWSMIEIAKYNCKDVTEARIREQEHHDLLKPTLKTEKSIDDKIDDVLSSDKFIEPDINSQITQNYSFKFTCEKCDYTTSRKLNMERHLNSDKHKKIAVEPSGAEITQKNEQIEQFMGFECVCGNIYKYNRGLSKHKKVCIKLNEPKNSQTSQSDIKTLTNLVLEVVKQNQELVTQNNELANKLVEISKNTHNNTMINSCNNNKTFNLNMFLNETCKDAMNITDFVDSLQLQLSDLEEVGKLGFVDGISNIIVKNLKAMDIHKRPVHCADKKREVIYIKDENKWEIENEEKNKLRKAIKRVAFKNEKLLPKYKELHPGCNYSDSKYSDQYSKLVIEAMGGDTDKEDKIIRKIAKEVIIDKS